MDGNSALGDWIPAVCRSQEWEINCLLKGPGNPGGYISLSPGCPKQSPVLPRWIPGPSQVRGILRGFRSADPDCLQPTLEQLFRYLWRWRTETVFKKAVDSLEFCAQPNPEFQFAYFLFICVCCVCVHMHTLSLLLWLTTKTKKNPRSERRRKAGLHETST